MESQLSIKNEQHFSWISRYIMIAMLLFSFTHGRSQTVNGTVKDKDNVRLMGASVVASSSDGKTVAYAITDNHGNFSLVIPNNTPPVKVTISYIGYQTKHIPFAQIKDGISIALNAGDFKLREVKVKGLRIKSNGDTLTYSVAGFRQKQDRSIADVIAKMPGLEVKQDGKIEYQGKTINKYYIEGLDLMGNQYGIANKNIPADKVMSIQVMQNHQPIKSLRNITFSDQAALNIVLKDEAKSIWTGTMDIGLGAGEDFLYDNRLTGMCFNKGFQTLIMYKNNNTGKDINMEVLDLTTNANEAGNGIVQMPMISVPNLRSERYSFNKSHLLAGNWLWRTGKNSELRLQANGLMDQKGMQSQNRTTYLTIGDLPIIVEEQTLCNTRSEWKGEINFQHNGNRTFCRSNLRGYIDFNKSSGTAILDNKCTEIIAKPQKRNFSEEFIISHTTLNKNVYEIKSNTSYNYLPEQLLTLNGETEKLDLRFISTQNAFKNKIKIGRHYINNIIGLDFYSQKIGINYDLKNNQHHTYQLLQPYWQPSFSMLFTRHKINAAVKLSYANQQYRKSKVDEFWVEPSLSWHWQLSSISELSTNLRYEAKPMMGKAIYDLPIFTNYQTQKINLGEVTTQHTLFNSWGYLYSNPIKGLFFNVRPLFSYTSGNLLYKSNLNEGINTIIATDKKFSTTMWGANSRFSKSFNWMKTTLGISATYTVSNYGMLVGESVNNARMNQLTIAIDYSQHPIKQLSIEKKSTMQLFKQQNRSTKQLSAGVSTHWQHNLNIYYFPTNDIMLTLKNELYHNSEHSLRPHYFCDLFLSYKRSHWEISLSAQNIIGTSLYETHILANTIESYSVTKLRPREFVMIFSYDL